MPLSDAWCAILLVALLCTFLSPSRRGSGRKFAVWTGALLTGITAAYLLQGDPVGISIAVLLGASCATLGPSPRSRQPHFGFGRSFASSSVHPGIRKAAGRW